MAPRGAQEGTKKHQSDERGDVQKTRKTNMVFEQFWVLGGVVLQPLGAFLGPKMQPGGDKKRNQKRDPKINKNGPTWEPKVTKKHPPKRYQKEASEVSISLGLWVLNRKRCGYATARCDGTWWLE